VDERSLPLDQDQVAARRRFLGCIHHQVFGRTGGEVGDDLVKRDAPARDQDAGLAGRHEDRAPAWM
jgi:hypothetical protein